MLTPAESYRQEAIGMLAELYTPEGAAWECGTLVVFRHGDSLAANITGMAENIRKLAVLGKSDRWRKAVEVWAKLVEGTDTVQRLRWAFIEGLMAADRASK